MEVAINGTLEMVKSVFVSSTSKDLPAHRATVKTAIERLGHHAIVMERFGAQHGDASEVSLKEVGKADIFISIIAYRYGHIPRGMAKSVTEQEYDEARRRGIPCLVYLVNEAYEWAADHPIRLHADNHPNLAAWKTRLKLERVVSWFTTPEDLAMQVAADLPKAIAQAEETQRNIEISRKRKEAERWEALRKKRQQRTRLASTLMFLIVLVGILVTGVLYLSGHPLGIFEPTPTPIIPAPSSDVLLVIADFTYIDQDAARVEPNLEREFSKAGANFVRVNETIESREEAQAISDQYNATIVMWGEVARGGVSYQFEITPRRSLIETTIEGLTVSVADIENFEGMDSLYVLDFTLGQLFYFEGNYEEALNAFQRAVDRIPAGREVEVKAAALFFYRGNAHSFSGDHEAAIADYDAALQLNPEYAYAYNNRGTAYHTLGDYAAAIADYDAALQFNPEDAGAYNNRGVAYADLGDYETAIVDYTTALQFNPEDAGAYNNRGAAYADLGDYVTAIADYDTAIQLDPEYALPYTNRGNVYTNLGNYEAAITDYNTAIQLDPEYALLYTNRGIAYANLGNYEAAIADYDTALQLNPEYAEAYNNRGIAYATSGDYESAITDYNTALQLDPDIAAAYFNRGTAYLILGDYETAITDYDAALQFNSEYAEAYGSRGFAYYALGQYDAAIADFHEYERLTGGLEPWMQDSIAEMEAALAEQNQGE